MMRPWLLVLAGLCAPALACGSGKDPEAQPDVLIVLVSGLRADRGGQPGGERALLQAFGEAPRRDFTEAYSQSVSPHLSLGSLLTGLYPSAIPLCGFADFTQGELAAQPWCAALPGGRATLPEAMAAYGWSTAFLHPAHLEQAAIEQRFQLEETWRGPVDWDTEQPRILSWWKQGEGPHLLVLQVADPMSAVAGDPKRKADPARVSAAYTAVCADLGQHLATLVAKLDQASRRPLLAVITSPHGLTLKKQRDPRATLSEMMSSELLDDAPLHVPLHFMGSDVRASAVIDQPVELRAVLPTVLKRAGAALPAGVEPLDLLSDDPSAWGNGEAYAEVGDMLALRKGRWLLRFRGMIDLGAALNPDLTTFLQYPVGPVQPNEDDLTFYFLFDPSNPQSNPMELTRREWPTVLALRDAMIAVRTGPAAPAPQAMDPEHLLELRITAAQGYW